MANCRVHRVGGKIEYGITRSGERSLLADSLLKLDISDDTMTEKWGLTYTPIFQRWFGNSKHVDVNGEPKLLNIQGNPSYRAEDGSTKHAILNNGQFTPSISEVEIEKINSKYALTDIKGNPLNIRYGAYERAEQIEKAHPTVSATVLQDHVGDYISISPNDSIYNQEKSEGKSDQNINTAMTKFLKTVGVKVDMVNSLTDSQGNPLDAVAKADMLQKLVQVVEGKAGLDTLPEEAAHFLVNLLEASGHPLFTALMNNISNYSVFKEVIDSPFYQEQYKGDMNMLKKEAVGKLIAQHVVGNTQGIDTKAKLSRLDRWIDKLVGFLRGIFGKVSTDPYAEAALVLLNDTVLDYVSEDTVDKGTLGEYFQETNETVVPKNVFASTSEKLDLENTLWEIGEVDVDKVENLKVGVLEKGQKTIDRYKGKSQTKVAGTHLHGRVSDAVSAYYYSKGYQTIKRTAEEQKLFEENSDFRMNMGTIGHAVLEDLINFHGNKKGKLNDILNKSPYNKTQFTTLSEGAKRIVKEARRIQKGIDPEGKVEFRTEQMITTADETTGGTVDVLVRFSDNSASIYDWKFVTPYRYNSVTETGFVEFKNKKWKVVEDPFESKMDMYDIQIGAYKKALLDKYHIKEIRQSRIVPIHIRYNTSEKGKLLNVINTLQMGTSTSEYLDEIPVAEEKTDFNSINDIIVKLTDKKRKLEDQIKKTKHKAGDAWEKLITTKKNTSKYIRKLQAKLDVAYVLEDIKSNLKGIDKRIAEEAQFLADGSINPLYLTIEDLHQLRADLEFNKNLLGVSDYESSLSSKELKEFKKTRDPVAGIINSTYKMVEMKLLERLSAEAQARGVEGLLTNNTAIGYGTSMFVPLSKQTNPIMRNLWAIVDDINFNRNKIIKGVAEEIQFAQDEMLQENPNAFDLLINQKTGNFVAKYNSDFYKARDKAVANNDWRWFKENTVLNQEKFDTHYLKYREGKLKALKLKYNNNPEAVSKGIAAWEKLHNVGSKGTYNTAAVDRGGSYFLMPKDSWIADSFKTIQSSPKTFAFYTMYSNKIHEIEDMYGERLGPGFIANVHKTAVEAMLDGSVAQSIDVINDSLKLQDSNMSMGMYDENTGQLIRKIPKPYISKLKNKKGEVDQSLKNYDLGKGLMLMFGAALDYQMKMEVLPEVQAMEAMLHGNAIKEIATDLVGANIPTLSGSTKKIFESKGNAKIYSDYIDNMFYGSTLNAKDFKAGNYSGIKSVLALKQYHSMVNIGFKVPVAAGAFLAGSLSLQSQAAKGKFITHKNLKKAHKALISADPKMRAIVEYFDVYQRDVTEDRARRLSSNYKTRHLTSDKFFAFLGTADKGVDATVAYALALNYGVDPETGELSLLKTLPEGTKSLYESMEIEENPRWKSTAGNVSDNSYDRYKVTIPGMTNKTENEFRNVTRAIIDKVKGTMGGEDIALYNNTLLMRLMMHYKSWLPGIARERFGGQKYDHILKSFDEGTWRSGFGNIGNDLTAAEALDAEVGMLGHLGSLGADLTNIGVDILTFGYFNRFKPKEKLARARFDVWAAENMSDPHFAAKLKNPATREVLYQDYLEMKQGNIRAFLMEFRLTLALFGLLMLIGGDWDDDGKKDIRQTWAGRKLYNTINRTYREIAVFTQPQEFLESGRATGIPLMSLGQNIISAASNTIDEIGDSILGEDSKKDATGYMHYTSQILVGGNALSKALELRPIDKQSEM